MSFPSPVLLALAVHERPTDALAWAAALAADRGASLSILLVSPAPTPLAVLFPSSVRPSTVDPSTAAPSARSREAEARALAWATEACDPVPGAGRIDVGTRMGDFIEETAGYAEGLRASFVVISGDGRRAGARARRLARAAGCPVLVARAGPGERAGRRVLAATDMVDAAYPVLRLAAGLSDPRRPDFVALHNVSPLPPPAALPPPEFDPNWAVAAGLDDERVALRFERLARASGALSDAVDAVVCHCLDPVDAILAESRRREADLVVVGTRPQSWLGRLVRGSTAERVANRSRGSVLVVPLRARRQAAR